MSTQTITDEDYETIRKCAVQGRMYRADVQLELGDIIENNLEGFLDLISTIATGSPLMQDISWRIVDTKGLNTLILEITGDVSAVVDAVEQAKLGL